MRPSLVLATLLAVLILCPEARAQGASEHERALSLHDEAKALYAQGRYFDAVEKLEQATAIDPEAKVLHYNLGLIEEKLGRLDRALSHYRRCLALETNPVERSQLETIIERVAGAQRQLDQPPAAPTPMHAVNEPSGAARSPLEARRPSPWIFVAGGVSVSALVTAAVLAARAASMHPGDEAMTTREVSIDDLQADADEAHRLAIATDVLLGVSAAGAIATIALALAAPSEGEPSLTVALGPGKGVLRWRF